MKKKNQELIRKYPVVCALYSRKRGSSFSVVSGVLYLRPIPNFQLLL